MSSQFQTKLVITFVALFAAVQVITFVAVHRVVRTNFVEQAEAQLRHARNIFTRHLEREGDQLAEAARVLASDFGFRQAVADRDRPTIRSALDNHGRRIGADRAMLVSLEGEMIADKFMTGVSPTADAAIPEFPFPMLLERAEQGGAVSALVVLQDRLYEIALVPVEAPLPIAWVVVGNAVDNALAGDIRELLPKGLELSFFAGDETGQWVPAASTLTAAGRSGLAADLDSVTGAEAQPATVILEDETYVSLPAPLDTAAGSAAGMAVLQYSLTAALAPYRGLVLWMAGITAGGLVLVVLGSVAVTRRVTKPIHTLVAAAERIRQGDYAEPVPLPAEREFGQLARSFNDMMSGIADREARIAHQASHDALTGLANRAYFESALAATLARFGEEGRNFSIFLVALDRLAEINTTLGHEVGDTLIRLAGERLRDCVQQMVVADADLAMDSLLAVHGTGTFVLLVPDVGPDKGILTAHRVLEDLDRPFPVGEINIDAGPRLGIACYPSHGHEAKAMLQRAEIALYAARQANSRCTIYSNEHETSGHAHLSLMGELRDGLARDELILHYQPKLALDAETVTAAEALIRWNHPVNGYMTPDEFIPLAERTGQIHKITQWALRQALAQAAAWRRDGMPLSVALNLSARDLAMTELPGMIRDALAECGLPAAALTLEITESAVMHDPDTAFRTLRALNAEGLTLAIDDFGTGYASLEYLQKLPVHELKIDKGFVLDLAANSEDRVIVRSIIDLGHNLGLAVTAEGVEDRESLNILKDLGCDAAQGFFIAKPLAPPAFEDLLTHNPAWRPAETEAALRGAKDAGEGGAA